MRYHWHTIDRTREAGGKRWFLQTYEDGCPMDIEDCPQFDTVEQAVAYLKRRHLRAALNDDWAIRPYRCPDCRNFFETQHGNEYRRSEE
jgi:hypothetical protein